MSYNALDNLEAAKQLRDKLILERDDLRASLQYEFATSWCSDCPQSHRAPDRDYVAEVCCKDDEVWDERHESEHKHERHLSGLIEAITAYLDEDG